MADPKDLKKQRDRFLAFAFASADLFLEISEDGEISHAFGAAKSLTGIDHATLSGRPWLDVFSHNDRVAMSSLHRNARDGQRCGPLAVTLDEKLGAGKSAIVTAIRMPDSGDFYLTLGFTSELMRRIAEDMKRHMDYSLLDKDEFIVAAKEALGTARSLGQDLEMTLLDIGDVKNVRKRLGEDVWNNFTKSVTGILGMRSVDGQAAAEIGDGRYSVIHNSTVNSDMLQSELEALAKKSDPEGKGFDVSSKTVSADLESLSERETMKALIYTINEFERRGTSLNIDTLNSSFKAYVSVNAQKIHQFKTIISQLTFDLHYQPIVNFETGEASHFEMLTRFRDGGNTQEWIMFGEDIGMAADFDIAVCDRAINYLMYKSSGRRTKFAVNLSGQSMQNEQFFRTLIAKLDLGQDLSDRLIFEITESNAISELEMVNSFIKTLQKKGYEVCLDDFGAGAASFQYLQKLHVDYVKIDGAYTQKILHSERDAVLLKNLSQMCKDLNIGVIAERIEDAAQVHRLKALSIPLGQGYFFAKPSAKPEYEPVRMAS